MALINCPECNKEVSDKVEMCPQCGYPFAVSEPKKKPKKKAKKTLAIILSSVALLTILVAAGFYIPKAIERNNIQETNNLLQSSIANNDYEKLQNELLNIQLAGYNSDRVHSHYSCALNATAEKAIENLSQGNFDAALLAMDSYVKIAENESILSLEFDLSFSKVDEAFYDFAQKAYNEENYSLALQAASLCGESNGKKIKILVVSEITKDGSQIAQIYQNLIRDINSYNITLTSAVISFELDLGDHTTLNPPLKAADNKIEKHSAEFLNYQNILKEKYPLKFLPEWVLSYYNATIALVDSGKKYSEGFSGAYFKPDLINVETTYNQALEYAENYNKALSALQSYLS